MPNPMPTDAKTQDAVRIRLFAEVEAVSAGAERKEEGNA